MMTSTHITGPLLGGSLAPTHYALDVEADLVCKTAVARDQAQARWLHVARGSYRPGQAHPTAGDRLYALERLAELAAELRGEEAGALELFGRVRRRCPEAWGRIAACFARDPDAGLDVVLAARRRYASALAEAVAQLRPEVERVAGMGQNRSALGVA